MTKICVVQTAGQITDWLSANSTLESSLRGDLKARELLKLKEDNDQEMAQSDRNSHSKNRGGKNPNHQSGTYMYTKKTYCEPNGQQFSQ